MLVEAGGCPVSKGTFVSVSVEESSPTSDDSDDISVEGDERSLFDVVNESGEIERGCVVSDASGELLVSGGSWVSKDEDTVPAGRSVSEGCCRGLVVVRGSSIVEDIGRDSVVLEDFAVRGVSEKGSDVPASNPVSDGCCEGPVLLEVTSVIDGSN